MFTKRLLFLTNHRLLSMVWKRGSALDCQIFPLTKDGRMEFSQHVAQMPDIPTYLLTELVEEDFRSDVIPHVIHRDRRAILDRKLSQIYRTTHYRLGIIQGREPDGRRDDRVLYTAITNPDLVRPWVELLVELGAPIAGVYSAPLLSTELLKALKLSAEHSLLVSVETGGGLRQSYFYQSSIKFSRLTPVSEINREDLPFFIADEVGKTWQYLDSLRYFTRADTLNVFILAHPDDHTSILESAPSIAQVKYELINIRDAATRIGLKEPLADSDATPIFIQLLGRRQPSGQFASPEETHGMRVWKLRVGLFAASAMVLGASVLWSGYNIYRTSGQVAEMQRLEGQAHLLAQQHKIAVNALPPFPVSPSVMRDSVTLYAALLANSPSPTRALQDISQVMDRFPTVRIHQVVWGLANDKDTILGFAPVGGNADGPLRSSLPVTPTAPLPGAAPDTSNATLGDGYQIAILEADIYPFKGDYRAALRDIEQFENALKTIPGVSVNLLARPVDLTSNATLTGQQSDSPVVPQARFSVKLTIELPKA
jgi:hypothetical protein